MNCKSWHAFCLCIREESNQEVNVVNIDVFILFLNAFLTTLISSIIVVIILRRKYLPAIRKMEQEQEKSRQQPESERSGTE